MALGTLWLRGLAPVTLALGLVAGTLTAQQRGGGRRALSSQPPDISVAFGYAADGFLQAKGGRSHDVLALDNLDLILHLNLKALPGLRGTSVRVHVQSNRGGPVSPEVGALQGISNLEAEEGWRVHEAWIEHQVRSPRLSVLAGIYDINSELDAIPSAGAFLNSAFGFGPEYGLSGWAGPSTFPSTGLAARLLIQPTLSSYGLLAVSDALPGDMNSTRFSLDREEGALLSFEVGYIQPLTDVTPMRGMGRRRVGRGRLIDEVNLKLALGGWAYSRRLSRWGPDPSSGHSWGMYILGERALFRSWDGTRFLSAFARVGGATAETNRLDLTLKGGLVYGGLFPGRPEDRLGLGVAFARNGSAFLREENRQGISGLLVERGEAVIELMYQAEVASFLMIQPNLQWVVNPGMNPTHRDAIVFGVRGHFFLEFPGGGQLSGSP